MTGDDERVFRTLPWKERGEVVAAVREGRTVRDPNLARAAIGLAIKYQDVPRPWSLRWFAGFAEVGPVPTAIAIVVTLIVANGSGAVVGIGAFAAVFVILAPWSRRVSRKRREAARRAEHKNRDLLKL